MEIRALYNIVTPEGVPIQLELGGLASRIFAFLIDSLLMTLLDSVLLLIFGLGLGWLGYAELSRTLIPLITFGVFFGYHVFQEWLWDGQTVGKKLLKIRVVRTNGQPIGFWESLGRNFMRILDVYTMGLGIVCMMFNRDERRFGDFIAGTLVIAQKNVRMAQMGGFSAQTNSRLTLEEQAWLQQYWRRKEGFLYEDRLELMQGICAHLSQRLGQSITNENDLQALMAGSLSSAAS